MTVLVVKDDKEGRKAIAQALQAVGIEYIMPTSFQACLTALTAISFDHVLLDLDLGDFPDTDRGVISGIDLLKEAKRLGIEITSIVSVSIENQGGFPDLIRDVYPEAKIVYDPGVIMHIETLLEYFIANIKS